MKLLDYSNISKCFILGDIHGDFKGLFHSIKYNLQTKTEDELHPKEIERMAKRDAKQKAYNELRERLNANQRNEYDEIVGNQTEPIVSRFSSKLTKVKPSYTHYNDSLIIVAGDCGFGFNSIDYYLNILTKNNALLELNNCHLLFLRGNHDDPSYFSEEKINLSNIKCISDYTVVKIHEKNILCVGGGLSVDRLWRKEQEGIINRFRHNNYKKLYWDDEMPNVDENELKELNNNNLLIDIVVTHTSPSFAYPETKFSSIGWIEKDDRLKEDLLLERESMNKLYHLLKEYKHPIKIWYYGHFHEDNEMIYDDVCFKLCINSYRFNNVYDLLNKLDMMGNTEKLTTSKLEDLMGKIKYTNMGIRPIDWASMVHRGYNNNGNTEEVLNNQVFHPRIEEEVEVNEYGEEIGEDLDVMDNINEVYEVPHLGELGHGMVFRDIAVPMAEPIRYMEMDGNLDFETRGFE